MSEELDHFIAEINKLFIENDALEDPHNIIAERFHNLHMDIIERAIDIDKAGLTEEKLIERFRSLFSEANHLIAEIIFSEEYISLPTSGLEGMITLVNSNLDRRIREIVSSRTGHSNDDYIMAVLISYLDANYLERNDLSLDYDHPEEIAAIINKFLEELESARKEVDSLNTLRDLLTEELEIIYSQMSSMKDIPDQENMVQIIFKAFNQEELDEVEQAILDSISHKNIELINNLIERLTSIIEDSNEAICRDPDFDLEDGYDQTTNPREILNEVYERIVSEYSYSDPRLTPAEVNMQIYLALEQNLLGEGNEYTAIPDIATHVTQIITTDEEIIAAIARLQVPLEGLLSDGELDQAFIYSSSDEDFIFLSSPLNDSDIEDFDNIASALSVPLGYEENSTGQYDEYYGDNGYHGHRIITNTEY